MARASVYLSSFVQENAFLDLKMIEEIESKAVECKMFFS